MLGRTSALSGGSVLATSVREMAVRLKQCVKRQPRTRDPAKVNNLMKRGTRGLYGGKIIQFGNRVSFSETKCVAPSAPVAHVAARVARAPSCWARLCCRALHGLQAPAAGCRQRARRLTPRLLTPAQEPAHVEAQRAEQALLVRDL